MIEKEKILNAYIFRHACKLFDTEKKISDSDMQFILQTAQLSPSSFGFEPWHFVVVQDRGLRKKLKEQAWGATAKLDTASHFVICLTMKFPLMKYDSEYIENFMRDVQKLPENVIESKGKMYEVFQKSDFNLTDERKLFDWAAKQCYIPLGNMMTSAAMIGIDSCPIEGFNQEISNTILKEDLGIDTSLYGISYMVAFGYRVNEPRPKTRRNISDFVTFK
ncbi:NAD(P)H-dependent oxidoreductase [Phaeocystidibacter marisrubri]|uniref:NAD(P)H-dependent oxidoreductase n=1 Tax=Phaeocystidibacter marisrubri TaxID=1577780 RepID=A0A6L3ZJS9_9FLAO|nr:NAD(P)H-dependent oxidoreductase [Phaeocystidibacter marisrubri]KAB2817665.1 NAD(P)H-dependent oxidoreductase [Phaeocystidibacter marisrubri]GGH74216.1 NAD(P)H-dependent oxidoreductase [Phaeocystidibacter marisrubri]